MMWQQLAIGKMYDMYVSVHLHKKLTLKGTVHSNNKINSREHRCLALLKLESIARPTLIYHHCVITISSNSRSEQTLQSNRHALRQVPTERWTSHAISSASIVINCFQLSKSNSFNKNFVSSQTSSKKSAWSDPVDKTSKNTPLIS